MRTYRRKRQQYLFASVLGIIAAINLLFFFMMYQPARSEYIGLKDSIQKTRADIQTRKKNIARLEKLSAQLETSAQDRQRLIMMHFIPKSTGWSEILPELDRMVRTTSVKNVRKDYTISPSPQYGLYSVKIRFPATGLYSNVVNLIKEIENSDTFFIINSVDVRGGNAPGVQDVSTDLNLETFFYQ
jgi:hypothetical protein